MERIICLLLGYVFGLFQTAFLVGKIKNIDIREHGSGNAGTTNALRTLGVKAGLIVFIGDTLKAVASALVVRYMFGANFPDTITVMVLYSGLGVVLGHNFPFYLNFKGGKGIAATAGVVISLGSWELAAIGFVAFVSTVVISKYISLGSLVMVVTVFIGFIIFNQMNMFSGLNTSEATYEAIILMLIFVAFAFIRHKANIIRLIHGNENKFSLKKK